MAFVLVNSSHLKPALDDFCKLLCALVGPGGHLCLLISSTSSLTLTSSSSRMIRNLPSGTPVFQFALQCIRSQTDRYGDGGLYCGILLSKLMIRLIDSPFCMHTACSILAVLQEFVQSELQNSAQLQIKVHLDSVQPLLAVARSVLFSKCGIFEGKDADAVSHANNQASLLVRAFLHTEAAVAKVLLSTQKNSNKQRLLNGVLYSCTDGEHVVMCGKTWQSVSILIFSVMLTDRIDCTEKEISGVELTGRGKAQLEAAHLFLDKAVANGINVIACQKVVHPTLLLKLRRKGILVLQRLGKRMADAIEVLSGAVSVLSLNSESLESLMTLKGHIKSVQHFTEPDGDFLLLEGALNSGICSLVLASRTLACDEELKVVAHQVLSALSQVIEDSAVCPGAGCTEVYLCCILWQKVHEQREDLCKKLKCSASQINMVLKWLQEALLLSSGLDFKSGRLAVDSVYHHAWKGSYSKSSITNTGVCNCGLVTSVEIAKYSGSWNIITIEHAWVFQSNPDSPLQVPSLTTTLSEYSLVLDVCSTKKSAFNLALDSCIAILNIGAIITKTD